MAEQKVIDKAKAWADKEYDELRYSKCEKKHFVFTFRELREMGKQAFIAGHDAASEDDWHYTSKGEYPTKRATLVIYWEMGSINSMTIIDGDEGNLRKHDEIKAWKYLDKPRGDL